MSATATATGTATWGWEYREPDSVDRVPPQPAPILRLPTVNLSLPGAYRTWSALFLAGFLATAGLVALISYVYRLGQSTDPSRSTIPESWPETPLFIRISLTLLVLLIVVRIARATHRQTITGRYRRWLRECAAEHERYRAETRTWYAQRHRSEQAERERHATEPRWYPISPAGPLDRVDVCGGTAPGWAAWLRVTGASLIAHGYRITLLDLTREPVTAPLAEAVRAAGHGVDRLVLPEQWPDRDVFAGYSTSEVAEALAESVHATNAQSSHGDRSVDLRILGEVCGHLTPPYTIARIAAGLRVILRREQPPGGPEPGGGGSVLSEAEYGAIADALGDTRRRQVEGRAAILEAVLHPLTGSRSAAAAPDPVAEPALRLLSVSEGVGETAVELLNQLLLQLAQHDLRGAAGLPAGRQVLVLAGADSLRPAHLENLARLARLRGFRLVLLFHHLREENIEILGAGGVVYVMRLGNTSEAVRAAEFIGKHHKFVMQQYSLTDGTGTSDSDAFGTNSSLSRGANWGMGGGGRSVTRTEGISRTRTQGTSTSSTDATANQRVYEFSMEPETLQSLPETMFIFVDPGRGRGPRARMGDSQPDLGRQRPSGALPVLPLIEMP